MTNTNKEQKETFESYWNKTFGLYDDGNNKQMLYNLFEEINKLKQLHDEDTTELQTKIKNLKEIIDLNLGQLNQQRDKIQELQTEITSLKRCPICMTRWAKTRGDSDNQWPARVNKKNKK